MYWSEIGPGFSKANCIGVLNWQIVLDFPSNWLFQALTI